MTTQKEPTKKGVTEKKETNLNKKRKSDPQKYQKYQKYKNIKNIKNIKNKINNILKISLKLVFL